MDIATLIGIVGGIIIVGWSIVSGAGSDVMSFVDLPSILLVFGGMMAATFIATPLKSVLGLGAIVKKAFLQKLPSLAAMAS
jgi:chemotaxis protein MotA